MALIKQIFGGISRILPNGLLQLTSTSSFQMVHAFLDLSKLPQALLPRDKHVKPSTPLIGFVDLSVILGLMLRGGVYMYRRNKYSEVRESWEKEYGPHRFSYKSRYKATNGFGKDNHVGKCGFGEVYKGTLPLNRDIAVKRLSHDAEQGMKQFACFNGSIIFCFHWRPQSKKFINYYVCYSHNHARPWKMRWKKLFTVL